MLFFGFLFVLFKKILDGFQKYVSEGSFLVNSQKLQFFDYDRINAKCNLFFFHVALIKYIKLHCNKKA